MKRFLMIGLLLMLVMALCGCNLSEYNAAAELYQAEQWEAAEAAFAALGNYRNSPGMVSACRYEIAKALYEEGSYSQAADIFSGLDFSNSAEMVKACHYAIATDLFDQQLYEAAGSAFAALGDYEDSAEFVSHCNFRNLLSHILLAGNEQDGYYTMESATDGGTIAFTATAEGETLVVTFSRNIPHTYEYIRQVRLTLVWGADKADYVGTNTVSRYVEQRVATQQERYSGQIVTADVAKDWTAEVGEYRKLSTSLYGITIPDEDMTDADVAGFQETFGMLLAATEAFLKELSFGASMKDLGFTAWN